MRKIPALATPQQSDPVRVRKLREKKGVVVPDHYARVPTMRTESDADGVGGLR